MIKRFIGGVWKKFSKDNKEYLFISLNGKPYNAYLNENKKGKQPDYQISVFEEASKKDHKD